MPAVGRWFRSVLLGSALALAAVPVQAVEVLSESVVPLRAVGDLNAEALRRSRHKAILSLVAHQYPLATQISSPRAAVAPGLLRSDSSIVRGYRIVDVARDGLLYRMQVAWDLDADMLASLLAPGQAPLVWTDLILDAAVPLARAQEILLLLASMPGVTFEQLDVREQGTRIRLRNKAGQNRIVQRLRDMSVFEIQQRPSGQLYLRIQQEDSHEPTSIHFRVGD